jgi:hypothetical protein
VRLRVAVAAPWSALVSRPCPACGSVVGSAVGRAVAVFAHQFIDDGTPPREWAERLYNVFRWTPMPSGGHFPSAEQPDLLSRDIACFFNGLPGAATSPE